jgi:hypothetical protein
MRHKEGHLHSTPYDILRAEAHSYRHSNLKSVAIRGILGIDVSENF